MRGENGGDLHWEEHSGDGEKKGGWWNEGGERDRETDMCASDGREKSEAVRLCGIF